jgi:uncharacterized protein (DUF1501 family)
MPSAGIHLNRRGLLQFGGLGFFGLTLPALLTGRASAASGSQRLPGFGKARSAILIFLKGGPSQLDTFDMKPDAPANIRGEFRPIATAVPGLQIGEHLPCLSRQAKHFTLVRSLTHRDNNHASAAYEMTTGHAYPRSANLSGVSTREDHPHIGSTVAALEVRRRPVPPFAMVPQFLVVNGEFRSGQNAGFLGSRFDPLVPGGDPNSRDFRPLDLGFVSPVGRERLSSRRRLLEAVDARPRHAESDESRAWDGYHEQALAITEAGRTQRALDIHAEPDRVRQRYGRNFFGQSVLLGRRLLEAGVRLVQVNCMSSIFGGEVNWDTHKNNFTMLKDVLLPRMDQGVAALLDDLSASGQLEETLVVVTGEFGRTPKINAGAGRDHWATAFSVLLAGGGLPAGAIFGATDRNGAEVADRPVTSGQLAATVFHALGIAPATQIANVQGRPWRICDEEPVDSLWR